MLKICRNLKKLLLVKNADQLSLHLNNLKYLSTSTEDTNFGYEKVKYEEKQTKGNK